MRFYARIRPWVRCRESTIKPRKNKDIQGKTKICKIKLKCSWYATAVFEENAENAEFTVYLGLKERVLLRIY